METHPGDRLDRLHVPESLQRQLLAYRHRIRVTKISEATAVAAAAWFAGFLAVYGLDRLFDTPPAVRGGLLLAAIAATALLPWFLHRWVWLHSDPEQLARLLRLKLPGVGDQLLGVLELTRSTSEQSRSLALCQAAMHQVVSDARGRDFLQAVPTSRHRLWSGVAGLVGLVAVLLGVLYPAAAAAAAARFAAPWSGTPRYTFTTIDPLPEPWVVPHGEPATLRVSLRKSSQWQPRQGELIVGPGPPLTAELEGGLYRFPVPPQIDSQWITIRIGDLSQRVRLEPTLRPALEEIVADVTLPEYLGRSEKVRKDVRGGALSVVKGSGVEVTATANRKLAAASIQFVHSGTASAPTAAPRFPSPPVANPIRRESQLVSGTSRFDDSGAVQFEWRDRSGLAGSEPFSLSVTAIDDEAPTLICEGLPRQGVVLQSELLKFKVTANDDFGIRRVGLLWRPFSEGEPSAASDPPAAAGERVLAAGDHEREVLKAAGTFSAHSLGIKPQPIELFVWAEDYLPGRPRAFSPPHLLYVLTPEEHALWIREQLGKWHHQALEVRDHELQLYATNQELRRLSPSELDQAETRQRIERQASAERSNGRRLAGLSEMGEELLRSAARNPEIGVGHLDRWAESLQVLKDVSANRMPTVADLLKQAAQSPTSKSPTAQGPTAGNSNAGNSNAGNSNAGNTNAGNAAADDSPAEEPAADDAKPPAANPRVVDAESSQSSSSAASDPSEPAAAKKPAAQPLRLPGTTVAGSGKSSTASPSPEEDSPKEDAAGETLAEAVSEQEKLLAEFNRIADELNAVLANLEGSTLVKRLKAASRVQDRIAGRISDRIDSAFGRPAQRIDNSVKEELVELAAEEESSSRELSIIMDDLAAYFQRRRFARFQSVLNEMRELDVIGGLRQLVEEIPDDQGLSLAQVEYWSDTLDRWADDLVDPASDGSCPGSKSNESLPPSIILEVMQILEAEMNLREETRVAEQAKSAQEPAQHGAEARRLAASQTVLAERTGTVSGQIQALPESGKHFAAELALLSEVEMVMRETASILRRPETGSPAIAAETEAIELLLQSKRINPKSGGGGGSAPGGGGTGTTVDSALALVGSGLNPKEVRESREVPQMTGETGSSFPEEFRQGLDEYFNRLEDRAP